MKYIDKIITKHLKDKTERKIVNSYKILTKE